MNVRIYWVDRLVQEYAKEPSREFEALTRRYKRLVATKRFRKAFPRYGVRPLVQGHGGGSYAYTRGGHSQGCVISLGSNRSEAVLLHEIAHHVHRTHREVYGPAKESHGPGFASALLAVVRVAQGEEAKKALRHLYSRMNIKVYRNGKVRQAHAPGEPPERAVPVIKDILAWRQDGRDSRALARAMYREYIVGQETSPGNGRAEFECPECGGTAQVSAYRQTYRRTWVHVDCTCGRLQGSVDLPIG